VRRLLAALAALLLALVGTVVLVAYVRGADARALEGVETVEVLVVDRPVPAGTPADQLADLVRTELLPAKAAAEGRVQDLAELAGRVADVDLQPGEQLLAARFSDPEDLAAPGTVAPPEGASEVSILLEPQRAVGGRLAAGDSVGVHVSLESRTHVLLHRVLVTQVQGAPAPAEAEDGTQTASSGGAAPSASLLVTLGLRPEQAEAVVFAMENGTVWLSLEPADVDPSGTEVLTPENVYEKDWS
jgi:pilus assembly protein CpaB